LINKYINENITKFLERWYNGRKWKYNTSVLFCYFVGFVAVKWDYIEYDAERIYPNNSEPESNWEFTLYSL
tara:strand:+ start:194 stop:406 length:213 start_codon:yes stop_codon:yes gene_type:complete